MSGPAAAHGPHKPGELQTRILQLLTNTANSWTVSEITSALGASSRGAVNAALIRLVETKSVIRQQRRPLHYYAASTSASTGHATTPPTRTFRSRTLAGMPDVQALGRLRAAGLPVLLYGPPGSGKTALIEAAFPDVVTVAGDGDTTTGDLVGDYTVNPDGTFTWLDGPLVRTLRDGGVLFLDDATLIPAPVLAAVYPAMDGRGQITVKAHRGESVTAAPGFFVVAGHNPGVRGAVLSEALASRFQVQISVESDADLAREVGVETQMVSVAQELARMETTGAISRAPQLRDLLAYRDLQSVLGSEAALANLVGCLPAEDHEAVIGVIERTYGLTVNPLTLGGRS